jgi:hypothetical protein
MVFIAFMLISNWMGSPEYLVQSSPEVEVAQELIPEEGHSHILQIPYDYLVPGTYLPGQHIEGNPHLTHGLELFFEAMNRHSCTLQDGPWRPCRQVVLPTGEIQYANHFTAHAMPDPHAEMRIEQFQHNVRRISLYFHLVDPQNPDRVLIDFSTSKYRHADSNYEEY